MKTFSNKVLASFTGSFSDLKELYFRKLSKKGRETVIDSIRKAETELISKEVIGTGDRIPYFEAVNYDGVFFDIKSELRKNHVVLSFYRGAWCPFCNLELGQLQKRIEEIRKLGANVIAIGPQNPDYSILFKARHNIVFPVLTDECNKVARKFGIDYTVIPEACDIFQHEIGVDFTQYNADPSDILPVPATYIIDKQGVVKYAFINPDYTQRLDPDTIIEELKKL